MRRREYVPRVECFLIYHRLLRQARQEGFSPIGWEKALQGANSAYTGSRRHPSVYRLLTYFVDTHPGRRRRCGGVLPEVRAFRV